MQSENPWYIETAELAEMLFPEAGELWLASRTPYISPKTLHEYELNLRTLGRAFGETKIREITADQIRAYQAMRMDTNCIAFGMPGKYPRTGHARGQLLAATSAGGNTPIIAAGSAHRQSVAYATIPTTTD